MPFPHIDHELAEAQSLDEIREWHRGVADALLDRRASVLVAIRMGSAIAPRFFGMTEAEVDDYHDAQRRELDRLTVLNLVASAEATIKVDFFRRVGGKRKDILAVAYREWHKALSFRKQLQPNFDRKGILELLRQSGVMDRNIIREYRKCLRARHWVGHGRYWGQAGRDRSVRSG